MNIDSTIFLTNIKIEEIIFSDSTFNKNSKWIKIKFRKKEVNIKMDYFWSFTKDKETIDKAWKLWNDGKRDDISISINFWPNKKNKYLQESDISYKFYLVDIKDADE
ncbi:hypothetical protein EMELA_v1c02670 [Mesoplasma melaleucae]|uniref:Uncharacterized protein n=1 Tax=Mesoplasma melaleucae TaxID=81459 RepID=A0A2K8NVH5_9MOLU|nr:hypothetical protein [Mesoplasma melaleucae]ATZ17840.1 hypothetical protein EMELA_v1c02670 [Mesoplasma melaleucae]